MDFGDDDEDDDNMTLSDAFGEFYYSLKLSTLIVINFEKIHNSKISLHHNVVCLERKGLI